MPDKILPKKQKSLELTPREVDYLITLLNEEIFKLSGVTKAIPKETKFKDMLKLADSLNEKIVNVSATNT